LRQNGYPAYVFDYSGEEKRKAKELLDERYRNIPEEARPKRTIRVEDQWGVFIGGYKDLESAGGDLIRVKKLKWDGLKKTDLDYVPNLKTGQILEVSPFAYSFASRNPTIPQPKTDPNAPDPVWKDLNDGRPFNLLKCGKPWTLAVKQLQGLNVVQERSVSSKFLSLLGMGENSGQLLDASAKQAEEVARVLRLMKFEAYVLHTRTASVITVGAYDSPEDPRLQQVQRQLRSLTFQNSSDPRAAQLLQFFAQPLPMRVPQL
jgi:hypothetical protein